MKKLLLLLVGVMVTLVGYGETKTDILKVTDATFAGTSSYQNFTIKSTTSGAEYSGNALSTNNTNFQFNKATSGIYVSKSAGVLVSVKYVFASGTSTPKNGLKLYGSRTVYTAFPSATALKTGIQATGTYSFNATDGFVAFCLTGGGNAAYLSQIEVTWNVETINDEVGIPSITYNEETVSESLTIQEDESLVIDAEKAKKIEILDEAETILASSATAPYTWTPEFIGTKQITVRATNGTASEETKFALTVTEAPKTLGEIVVTYGDGKQVSADDEITVESGTSFTFISENATTIKLEGLVDGNDHLIVDKSEIGSTITWTPTSEFNDALINVHSTLGEDYKDFSFFLTVTEPYVEPVNPDATYVYTLVTDGLDIRSGQEYLIAASKTNRVMATQSTNNRASVEVVVDENEIWNLPETAQIVKLVNSSVVEGSFDIQVGETDNGDAQYLYAGGSPTATKNQNYLKTTTYPSESSAANISIDSNNVVNIDFSKASGKQGRYMQYNGASTNTLFACYVSRQTTSGYEYMRLFKKVELPGMPAYDQFEADETKVAIKIIKGQLHVKVTEYDSDNNEVVNDIDTSLSSKVSYSTDADWVNPVTVDKDGFYVIDLPKTEGNYIKIQAKNELNGYHSDELIKFVDAKGDIVSGIEGVVTDDENAPVEYFNLQGIRVAANQPGIYIRRQGSKVEKVSIAR